MRAREIGANDGTMAESFDLDGDKTSANGSSNLAVMLLPLPSHSRELSSVALPLTTDGTHEL